MSLLVEGEEGGRTSRPEAKRVPWRRACRGRDWLHGPMAPDRSHDGTTATLRVGADEIVVRHKYEVVSIVNDIMVAAWFVAGSLLFFSEATTTAGTWLFLLGSVQLMIRPVIRLARRVHLRRLGHGTPSDSDDDY